MRLVQTGLAAALAAAVLGALLGTDAARAADPIKIRLSYVVPISNWADMVAQKKDLTGISANPTRSKLRVSPGRRR